MGNINETRKLSSVFESETGLTTTIGFKYLSPLANYRTEFFLGVAKLADLTYTPNISSGLKPDELNYVGNFVVLKDDLTLDGNFNWIAGEVSYANVGSNYLGKKLDIHTDYEFLDKSTDSRLHDDISNLLFNTSYKVFSGTNFRFGGRPDLTEKMVNIIYGVNKIFGRWSYGVSQSYVKSEAEKLNFEAIYDDNCTNLTFGFERRYQKVGESEPIDMLSVRLKFKPFADVGFSKN